MKLFKLSDLPSVFTPGYEDVLKYGKVTVIYNNEY